MQPQRTLDANPLEHSVAQRIRRRRTLDAFGAFLPFLVLALLIGRSEYLPFFDLPNHLTRAYVMSHIDENASLAARFSYAPHLVPYYLADLLFSKLLAVLAPSAAGRAWMITLLLILFPLAVLTLLRVRHSAAGCPAFWLVVSVLATNYFFVSAFHAYCLSVSMVVFAAAAWEHWLRSRTGIWFLAFAGLVLLSYLAHLAGLFFAGIWIGTLAMYRLYGKTIRFRECVLSALPIVLLVALHAGAHELGTNADESWELRPLTGKLLALGGILIRFNYTIDIALIGLLAFVVLVLIFAGSRAPERSERGTREWLVLAIAFTLSYFFLPKDVRPALDVDSRSLPFLALVSTVFAFEIAPPQARRGRAVLVISALLAIGNICTLGYYWDKANDSLEHFDEALRAVPGGSTLLSISTWKQEGRMDFALHQAELYVVYSDGLTPDIFSNTTAKNQFPYFAYRSPLYSPGPFWYLRNEDDEVRWQEIARTYRYLLVTKPFDRERIRLPGLSVVFHNEAAVVFEVPGTS